jgi:hypothetical protein
MNSLSQIKEKLSVGLEELITHYSIENTVSRKETAVAVTLMGLGSGTVFTGWTDYILNHTTRGGYTAVAGMALIVCSYYYLLARSWYNIK